MVRQVKSFLGLVQFFVCYLVQFKLYNVGLGTKIKKLFMLDLYFIFSYSIVFLTNSISFFQFENPLCLSTAIDVFTLS